ncbi:MAG TPA: hypothetical protein PLF40_18380 [Kofleriaceae bacterium]|nr:hypothetical protein [Kofleriaceae bacterium]
MPTMLRNSLIIMHFIPTRFFHEDIKQRPLGHACKLHRSTTHQPLAEAWPHHACFAQCRGRRLARINLHVTNGACGIWDPFLTNLTSRNRN